MATKFEIGHNDNGSKINIDVRQSGDSILAFIKENVGDKELPVRVGYLEFVGQGDNQFMTIRAPIRMKDDDGEYLTRPRQKEGKFLDARGQETTEDKAAREYVPMTNRNDPSKLVYGQIASLNIKNTKADGSPTAVTLVSAKFYTDDEALDAERIYFKLSRLEKDAPDYQTVSAELKEHRKNTGTWKSFFINGGAEALRERGFNIRVKERAPASDGPDA